MDLRSGYQSNAEKRATQQHQWFAKTLECIGAIKEWTVKTVIFTGGTMGSVLVKDFEDNMKELGVKKESVGPNTETACLSAPGGS